MSPFVVWFSESGLLRGGGCACALIETALKQNSACIIAEILFSSTAPTVLSKGHCWVLLQGHHCSSSVHCSFWLWLWDSHWQGGIPFVEAANMEITIDVSLLGWGAHCQHIVTQGKWSDIEKRHSINWLELKTIWLVLFSLQQVTEHSQSPFLLTGPLFWLEKSAFSFCFIPMHLLSL